VSLAVVIDFLVTRDTNSNSVVEVYIYIIKNAPAAYNEIELFM